MQSLPVLVLNANYEPIHVTSVRRAVNLMLGEKAYLILNGRGFIRSVARELPIPSVIRLNQMVNKPRQSIHLSSPEIFIRDNHTCQYCGASGVGLTVDHVIPRHLGGKHVWENVVTACARCNHLKGGRTPEQARMQLRSLPKAPPTSAAYRYSRHLSNHQEWENFIRNW